MTVTQDARLVVLLSGRGTNYAALQAAANDWLGARIAGIISDRPTAPALDLAHRHGTDSVCVDRGQHPDRTTFEASLAAAIDGFKPSHIVLAGFMRVLSADFVRRYHGKMINIHPSLLPRYRGLDTHQRALDAGDAEHGASVHFVTPELDSGPVISQVRMPVLPRDDAASLSDRLLALEHRLLPSTMALLLQRLVELRDGELYVENRKLDHPLQLGRDLDDRGRLAERI
ncbi:MAG: phosphoribosylglycinamide formyltransferase [Wenzhouxiangella sp.]